MRIDNILVHTEKILKFVKALQEDDTAIYTITRNKLTEIALRCNEIESVISEILGNTKPRGFSVKHPSNCDAKIEEILQRLNVLESQMNINKTDSKSEVTEVLTKSSCKFIIHSYAKVLDAVAENMSENSVIDTTSGIIWKWFNKRFLTKHPDYKQNKYDITKLKDDIAAIVVFIGYYVEQGNANFAFDKLNAWIEQLGKDREITENYVIPYECLDIYKNRNEKYVNTAAILIWKELYDLGYSELGNIEIDGKLIIPNVKHLVYDVIYELEDKIDDKGTYTSRYTNIADNPTALLQYNII